MNEMERHLQDAMAARASGAEPQDETEALARIEGRLGMNRRRWISLAGAAAAIFLVAGALVLLTRGDDKQQVNVSTASSDAPKSTTTSTTIAPTTTSSPDATSTTSSSSASGTPVTEAPTTSTVVAPPPPPHIWPFPNSSTSFATPEAAAQSFVVDYLGMTNARVGATNGGAVEVFGNSRASIRTVVDTVDSSAGWVVVGARADEIVIDQPQPNADPTDPMTVSGTSTAFEAQLGLQLRLVGGSDAVSTSTAMGGSNGEMGPFSTTISVPPGDAALVLIVFEGDASGEQTYSKASVVLLRTGGPATASDGG